MDKLNVFQRLSEVRKSVPSITKNAKITFGGGFDYASSSQVLKSINEAINENGLFLITEILDQEITVEKTAKGQANYFTKLTLKYTWVNIDSPEDKVSVTWNGQGFDNQEKGIGKALTYAEKYFILKFFNIPTDKDDPDYYANKNAEKNYKNKKQNNNYSKQSENPKQNKPSQKELDQQKKQAVMEIKKCQTLEAVENVIKKYPQFEDNKGFLNIAADHQKYLNELEVAEKNIYQAKNESDLIDITANNPRLHKNFRFEKALKSKYDSLGITSNPSPKKKINSSEDLTNYIKEKMNVVDQPSSKDIVSEALKVGV